MTKSPIADRLESLPSPSATGYAFCSLQGTLYPTVGLRTPNEAVRANFGAEPFAFDIESLVLVRPLPFGVQPPKLDLPKLMRIHFRSGTETGRLVSTLSAPATLDHLVPGPFPPLPCLELECADPGLAATIRQ